MMAWYNRDAARDFPSSYTKASLDNRFVTTRNGVFDFARGEDTGWGVSLADQWDGFYLDRFPDKYTGEYIRNEYVLENLQVLCNASAVKLEGSHSVIRNCVIESKSRVANFTAGSDVLIENCKIRLRKNRKNEIDQKERRAAIVLRDGSNTIIRNNIIQIDYGGDVDVPTHCILVKDGAKNVLIEGNTFINVKGDPVTLEDASEAIVRDNKTEMRRWLF